MASGYVIGGDKWEKILKRLAKESNVRLEVGVLEGRVNAVTGEPIAPYAFANEFGTDTIPARPAFGETVVKNEEAWAEGLANMLRGKSTVQNIVPISVSKLGSVMASNIQETIASNMPPPNSPVTVKRKQKDMGTLEMTGSYLKSIDFRVLRGK